MTYHKTCNQRLLHVLFTNCIRIVQYKCILTKSLDKECSKHIATNPLPVNMFTKVVPYEKIKNKHKFRFGTHSDTEIYSNTVISW